MFNKDKFLGFLENNKIEYKIFNHPPLFTVEESKKIRGTIDGAHTKNLLLKNKKNDFFLFTCLESTKVDLKKLKKALQLKDLSFAKEKYLEELLNVKAGSVTPFGLLNDKKNQIIFFLDHSLNSYDTLNFHPLVNTSTINIKKSDFYKILKLYNKKINTINYDTYESDFRK